MFGSGQIAAPLIMALTIGISLLGLLKMPKIIDVCLFRPYHFHRKPEYETMILSGFVHADMAHLFFNMFITCMMILIVFVFLILLLLLMFRIILLHLYSSSYYYDSSSSFSSLFLLHYYYFYFVILHSSSSFFLLLLLLSYFYYCSFLSIFI